MTNLRQRIQNATEAARNAVGLAIGRAVLLAINDAGRRQLVQLEVLSSEIKEDVERVQEYGRSSVPLPGAQALVLFLGGGRDHPVVISADDPRYRKTGLLPGEVADYTDEGDYLHFKRGRVLELNTDTLVIKATTKVRLETPLLECTGEIIDRADDGGQRMSEMREVYNNHTHPETNSGNTEEPNQLMGGGA